MQIWTNIWKKRDASTYDSSPYYVTACASYDEAMEDLQETGEQFSLPALKYNTETRQTEQSRHYYDYVCTQFSRFDKGVLIESKCYTDLASEIASWSQEQQESTKAYYAAATLSASQLCRIGG